MSSTKLGGYLLAIGPILMLIVMMGVWPAVVGTVSDDLLGQDKIKAQMELAMENITVTRIIATLMGLGMISLLTGYTFWARSLQGDDKRGGILGTVAALTLPVVIAAIMLSMDFHFAAADTWLNDDQSNALIVATVGDSIAMASTFVWAFLFLGVGLTGLAASLQATDTFTKSLGAIISVVAAVSLVINYSDIGGAGFIVFMIFIIVTVISGINLIRKTV
ncbi:MAG: hypothetical protein ACJ0BL_05555 [Dehalococcoidia bacterium]